jgi:hypothetical protein
MVGRHDRDDDEGPDGRTGAAVWREIATANAADAVTWPSNRLIPTATASANAVQIGASHPNPAFALRHQSVRYARHATAMIAPAARDTCRARAATRAVASVAAARLIPKVASEMAAPKKIPR